MGRPDIDAKVARAAERRLRVLELRKEGYTFREIGSRVGVSECQAHRDYKASIRQLAALQDQSAEEARTLEDIRLDEMQRAIYPHIISGNLFAVDRGLKISESRRKMWGIDRPAKIAPTSPDGEESYAPPDVSRLSRQQLETLDAILGSITGLTPLRPVPTEEADLS